MRQFLTKRVLSTTLVAGTVLSLGVFAFAQTQTTSTSQSQSNGGSASSSASASSRGQSGGSVMAGQAGIATGAVAGAPVKGTMYIVNWSPNLQARPGAGVFAQHQEYLKTYGKEVGLLMEGVLGGDEPGRMAIIQGNPQKVREFAVNSPLMFNGMATYQITPYSVEYSRVGVVVDKSDAPATAKDGEESSSSQSSQSTQSSGSGGG